MIDGQLAVMQNVLTKDKRSNHHQDFDRSHLTSLWEILSRCGNPFPWIKEMEWLLTVWKDSDVMNYYCLAKVPWIGQTKNCAVSVICPPVPPSFCVLSATSSWNYILSGPNQSWTNYEPILWLDPFGHRSAMVHIRMYASVHILVKQNRSWIKNACRGWNPR